ncbi:DUF3168 domain-containing protein [Nocardiopsis alba]|uniref:DUF3168 domain-containing protein n=1 Tax=Nocardiopsis alba TaxID=53437 RepID=UPI003D71708B
MMTSPSALDAVQAALYARLTGDAELMALVSGVYDDVAEGTPYPYVALGESMETPDNTHDGKGRSTVVTLHVWSRYAGFTEATRIAGRLVELLDERPLNVTGRTHISTRFEFSQTLRDPDPRLRHVPVRFRVSTEQ